VEEKNLSLTEFYNADEVFACGTMGELTPLYEIDGRMIENRSGSNITQLLSEAFKQLIPQYCEKLP
jgi:branched-chain amino acid aminotransferase